jgi:hypothetical protein
LQTKKSDAFTERVPVKQDDGTSSSGEAATRTISYAGKTLDLTLFAVCRAVDVLVGELWARRRSRRKATQKWTQVCGTCRRTRRRLRRDLTSDTRSAGG